MKKKSLLLLLLLLLVPFSAHGTVTQDIIVEQMESSGAGQLSDQLQGLSPSAFDLDATAKDLASGTWSWDFGTIINAIFGAFFGSFRDCLGLLLQLVALALLGAVVESLQGSFGRQSVAGAAFLGCYVMIAVVAVKAFMTAATLGEQVVNDMVVFMNSLVPVTLSLVAMSGAPVSSGIFHPVLMVGIQAVALIIRSVVFPLIMLSTAAACANHISGGNKLSRIAALLKNAAKWILGLTLTIFIGVVTLQGAVMPSVDNITLKTAKFTVGSFVPVVGGILSDSVDVVFSCGRLMKNAVGIAGLIGVCLICFAPAVRLLAHSAVFHVAGALIEPVSDKRITALISELGSSLSMVFTMALTVCMMFVINMAIIIGATNFTGVSG